MGAISSLVQDIAFLFLSSSARRDARMIRTGLICVLAIAAVAGVLFGLYPELDLQVARYFHAIEMPDHDRFALRYDPSLTWARNFCLWIPALLVAPAVGALVIKLILPCANC